VVLPLGLPSFAEMVAEPGPLALTSPLLAATVATDESEELHVMLGMIVASSELPSLKIATARIWELVLLAIVSTGTTLTFETELASTVVVVVSVTAPQWRLCPRFRDRGWSTGQSMLLAR